MEKLTLNQKKLIEDNLGIIYKYCAIHNIMDEDIRQYMCYYACRNIKHFDDTKGKITTFLIVLCRNAVAHYYRNMNCLCRKGALEDVSLEQTISDDMTLLDTLSYTDNYFDSIGELDYVRSGLMAFKEDFPELAKYINVFIDNKANKISYDKLSKKYNITKHKVMRVICDINYELPNYFLRDGE